MPTTLKRTAFNPVQTFREHLTLKKEASLITTRSEALKKRLKEWLPTAAEAEVTDTGSYVVALGETVEVAGKAYKGMELRRSVRTTFNEDKAEKILKKKGVYEEALSTYVDQEKIYRLLAEDKITEKDLNSMFEEAESFAFWPLEGEVIE